jgi:CrcB protein
MIKQIIIVAIGGAAGSVLRYLATIISIKFYNNNFPIATFIVNILGCLLIGIFIGIFDRYGNFNENFRLLLITGFCGGFTTFSAFSSENISLMQNGNTFLAITYIGLSVIIGLLAVWFGLYITKI